MTARLPENLDLIAAAPEGIRKLRGLILELAVRGKLVPQDPNDEPASELLKRIAKERARLDAEGICKKTRATPVDESNRLFELPVGWEWCRFPDVANYKMGKTPPTKEAAYWAEDGIPWVSISDMSHGQRIATTSRTVSNAAREKVFRSAPAPIGTLLMSFKLTVGKVATLGINAFHNEAIISIYPFKGVSQEFLSHFLPMIAQGGNSKSALMGDTLNSESLALLSIPLPPLAEQHRIVAKVDELMALCDLLEAEQTDAGAAHARLVDTLLGTLTQSTDAADLAANWQRLAEHFDTLFTTESSLDTLKQTILQLAVMGKLVPQNPNDEPASELLKRIAKERARLEAEGTTKKSKPLPPVGEDEQQFELPDGWEWLKFGTVVDLINGDRSKNYPNREEYAPAGVAWINTGHIEPGGTLATNGMHFITREKFDSLRSGKIEVHDLVYCLRGATFGKTASVTPYSEGAIASSLVIVRPHLPSLQRYLFLYLTSPFGRSQIFRFDNGSAQPNLSANSVTLFAFPLPPLAEQHRIVAKVDELLALVDRLKASLAESRARQERLATTLIESALKAA